MEATALCAPNNGLIAHRMLNGQSDALLGPSGTPLGRGLEMPLG